MISLNTEVLSGISFYFFNSLYAMIFIITFLRSPWSSLKNNLGLQHLCFGATVLLVIIWSIKADVTQGISIHFMGVTALTLVLGWDLAIVCATVALAMTTFFSGYHWQNFATNGAITILLPVLVSQCFVYLAQHKLPKNFFVYLFICAFFAAALTAGLVGFGVAAILWLNDVYPWQYIQQNIVTIIVLTLFPEGLLNGILMTAIMVFYPDWIRSFNARQYIDEQ